MHGFLRGHSYKHELTLFPQTLLINTKYSTLFQPCYNEVPPNIQSLLHEANLKYARNANSNQSLIFFRYPNYNYITYSICCGFLLIKTCE